MDNLADAITALQYVKARIRSNNKSVRPELSNKPLHIRYQDQMALKGRVDSIRNHHRFPINDQITLKNVILYGAYAVAAGYGNCLEMSCACAWYLNGQGRFRYDLVHYPGSGDHIFLVLGQVSAPDGTFPDDFSAWDANAVICDAWADIACPAREYPARWRARMNNWRIMGWSLANRLPTEDIWFNLVDRPKRSYFGATG